MKAISLWQPWATFVTLKWKTIETRTHDRFKKLVGQRIAIHAAKTIDQNGILTLHKYRELNALDAQNLATYIVGNQGKILCTATIIQAEWAWFPVFRHRHEELEKQAMCDIEDRHLLFLEDIKPVYPAMPFKGHQGIFNVPDELVNKKA